MLTKMLTSIDCTALKDADALINSLTSKKLLRKQGDTPDSEDEYAKAEAETSRGLRPNRKPAKNVGGKRVSESKSKGKGKAVGLFGVNVCLFTYSLNV